MIVKKFVPVLMTAGVMASFMGCAEQSDPVSVAPPTPAVAPVTDTAPVAPTTVPAITPETTPPESPAAADAILVSLSVPNMF